MNVIIITLRYLNLRITVYGLTERSLPLKNTMAHTWIFEDGRP